MGNIISSFKMEKENESHVIFDFYEELLKSIKNSDDLKKINDMGYSKSLIKQYRNHCDDVKSISESIKSAETVLNRLYNEETACSSLVKEIDKFQNVTKPLYLKAISETESCISDISVRIGKFTKYAYDLKKCNKINDGDFHDIETKISEIKKYLLTQPNSLKKLKRKLNKAKMSSKEVKEQLSRYNLMTKKTFKNMIYNKGKNTGIFSSINELNKYFDENNPSGKKSKYYMGMLRSENKMLKKFKRKIEAISKLEISKNVGTIKKLNSIESINRECESFEKNYTETLNKNNKEIKKMEEMLYKSKNDKSYEIAKKLVVMYFAKCVDEYIFREVVKVILADSDWEKCFINETFKLLGMDICQDIKATFPYLSVIYQKKLKNTIDKLF